MMMASDDKANCVLNYFTFEISNLTNHSTQSLPIYEIIADTQNGHIQIMNPENFITNSAINTQMSIDNDINQTDDESDDYDNSKNNESNVNIIESLIITNASSQDQDYSANECETQSENCDDLIDEDENDENNNENEDESDDLEDLTNLNWLTELKNITNLPPAANDINEKPCDPPSQRFDKFISQVNKMRENYEKRRFLYETVTSEKPPFNYAQIIGMALIDEGRMTLKQICDWIEKKFAYYKFHRNWNNSIRHNLSLNFFFTKVARDKNEKGKGGYWELAVDVHKTARKRIRHRRKKIGDMQFQSSTTKTNSFNRNGRSLRSRINSRKESSPFNEMSVKSVGSSNVSDFISSPSNINEDSNPSMEEQNVTEIEIVEEQQNINNIIDDNQNAIIIPNPTLYDSPNVIVEAIPTYQFNQFNHIENFDENELNQLICMNDQELIDDFLNFNSGNEEFL
ncbi:unnamed protein product [Chironomus riparius]|uniref:Fork-head domain-containing protein n=1 Tax=Chironomus riparius TaxID=315576 RepID=A0A9N9WL36_9DIPT|nr:unnamed protein product [Chironomus riparius]